MNIKKITKTILFDNINSSDLYTFKNNWNNSIEIKKIPLYCIFKEYFEENNNLYYIYLGINNDNKHVFSLLDILREEETHTICCDKYDFIKSKLIAIEFGKSTKLFKIIKLNNNINKIIYEIIKNTYKDPDSTDINTVNLKAGSSIFYNSTGTTSFYTNDDFVKKDDLTTLENRVQNLENKFLKFLMSTK